MTLLQYVIEQNLGPPVSTDGNGSSTWSCPRHEDLNPSFSTYPHNEKYKDRFGCFSCGHRGDIHDFLQEVFPSEDYGQRKDRIAAYLVQYNKVKATSKSEPLFCLSGEPERNRELEGALANVLHEKLDLETIIRFIDVADKSHVDLGDLGAECARFVLDLRDGLREHAAVCTDEFCGNECRRARGLPPISKEKQEELRRRHDRDRLRAIDKAAFMIRRRHREMVA